MIKLQDFKLKDQNPSKSNYSILNTVHDKSRPKKNSIFPPNLKITSGISIPKQATKELKVFKKIKSLSPIMIETQEMSKENRLNSTLIKLRLDKNPHQENMHGNVEELIIDIEKRVEEIEKKFGNSQSNGKIREYLNVFDDFSSFFKDFRVFLSKFKRLFEQIFLKSILLTNELHELRESLKKKQESVKDFQILNEIDEIKLKRVSSDESLIKLPYCKRNSYVSTIKSRLQDEEFTLPRQKSSEILEIKSKEKSKLKNLVPKLLVSENIVNVQDFQDEFMQNIKDFSESWRNLLEEQKRF